MLVWYHSFFKHLVIRIWKLRMTWIENCSIWFQENTIQKNDIFSSGLFQAAVLKLYESDRAAAWKQRTTSSTLNIVLLAFLFFYSFKVLLVKRHIHNRLFFFFLFKCMLYYDHWNLFFNSPIYLSVVWQKHERKFLKCISLPGV